LKYSRFDYQDKTNGKEFIEEEGEYTIEVRKKFSSHVLNKRWNKPYPKLLQIGVFEKALVI
jgi:hypothetical protein